MNTINLFTRLLYAQVILGIIAYGVAERSVAMVLATGALAVLSWYVVEGPGGRHAPHWIITVGVVIATFWTIWLQVRGEPMILALGDYILYLQLFKLYDRKLNRDYAQLMVLSLMQMICAAIISAEVIFAIMLVAYLGLALLTAMAFQLKLGYDEVAAAMARQAPAGHEPPRPRSVSSGGHERSFRRLALGSGVGVIVLSVGFFLLMPRGRFADALGQWKPPAPQSVTGFAAQVQLTSGRQITASRIPVMNVRVLQNGVNIGSEGRVFMLRGTALDIYHQGQHRWMTGRRVASVDRPVTFDDLHIATVLPPLARDVIRQEVTLRASTENVLFAIYAPAALQLPTRNTTRFNPIDQTFHTTRSGAASLEYAVESVVAAADNQAQHYLQQFPVTPPQADHDFDWKLYGKRPVLNDAAVRGLAQQITAARGLSRDAAADSDPADAHIAKAIETYLRSNHTYTLDLPRIDREEDPIRAFLFEHKRGHCEYFASAMCAMLRSLGIRSRVISGFVAGEFNSVGGYYVVRELNAHAWVEAWTADRGWQSFDPSPPGAMEQLHHPRRGIMARLRDLYEYAEFQWISNVITYDENQRRGLVEVLRNVLADASNILSSAAAYAANTVRHIYLALGQAGRIAAGAAFVLMVILAHLYRRRAVGRATVRPQHLVGWASPPVHVPFYDDLLELLSARGLEKPAWQTPRAFAFELLERDGQRFAEVSSIVESFYEVRFGGQPLDDHRRAAANQRLDALRRRFAEPADATGNGDRRPAETAR